MVCGSSPRGEGRAGAVPSDARHEVVADHRDPNPSQSLDGGALVLDLFVTAGQAQLDLLGGQREALHPRNRQACGSEFRLDPCERIQILLSPDFAQLTRDAGDGVIYAHLAGKLESGGLARFLNEGQFYARGAAGRRPEGVLNTLAVGTRCGSCGHRRQSALHGTASSNFHHEVRSFPFSAIKGLVGGLARRQITTN